MDKCYLCGVESVHALLHEGIHKKFGIVHVCHKCYSKDKMPLIEKKEIDMNEINKRGSVRERLSRMANVDMKKEEVKKIKPSQDDVNLKDLIEKNFKKEIEIGPQYFDNLVDNFNWVVMRKRRIMKLTRGELADAVMEQPLVIEALEGGNLPKDYSILIKKIENYLGIRLLKKNGEVKPEEIMVESKIPSGILISDLKKKTEEKKSWLFGRQKKEELYNEEEILEPEEVEEEKIENKSLDELSDEEINDLIWGRK